MSTNYPQSHDLKLCPFDPSFNTNSQYICFQYEKCCRQGCCSTYSYTYFQSWYFWIFVVLFFVIFYGASWYCKKIHIAQKRRLQAQNGPASGNVPLPNSPRNNGNNVDHLLDCLIETYRAQSVGDALSAPKPGKHLEPPPKYHEAINMPKLEGHTVQVVQIHVNGSGSATRSPNLENGTGECPPTYEDATRNSSRETGFRKS